MTGFFYGLMIAILPNCLTKNQVPVFFNLNFCYEKIT